MGSVPVSLAMIVRNCAQDLDRCLGSVADYVDDIVIVNTGNDGEEGFNETTDVALKHNARVIIDPWQHDFAHHREVSFREAKHKVVMWLDSDDEVIHPDRLRVNIDDMFFRDQVEALMVLYDYEHDENDISTTLLSRERVVDKSFWEWRGVIHECLCARWQFRQGHVPPDAGYVKHHKLKLEGEKQIAHLKRNLDIIERNYGTKISQEDKRMLFYWGMTLLGLNRHDECVQKLREYLRFGDNEPEMYTAMVTMAEAQRVLGHFDESMSSCERAMRLCPQFPWAPLAMAEIFCFRGEWDRAAEFSKRSISVRCNANLQPVQSPLYLHYRPEYILGNYHALRGEFDQMRPYFEKAKAGYGESREFKDTLSKVKLMEDEARVADAILRLKAVCRPSFLDKLREEMHEEMLTRPVIARQLPERRDPKKCNVVIICPPMGGEGEWGPQSLESGIGGSEEAVVRMSRALARKGFSVEVYNNRESIERDGEVVWKPLSFWNGESEDGVDVAIYWRAPFFPRERGCRAIARYLWLHDVQDQSHWGPDLHEIYDGVMVLSPYHQSLTDWVPQESFFLTGNGIDSDQMPALRMEAKKPHMMVWPSDPSRGLDILLEKWGIIRREFKDAELHVFYGWSPTFVQHMQYSKRLFDIHQKIEHLRKLDGIVWHGRVGQRKLDELCAQASIWPYSCDFPEISCITAMKMQALGVWPVVPDMAALKHTVVHGDKLSVPHWDPRLGAQAPIRHPEVAKKYVELLIQRLRAGVNVDEALEMSSWARGMFSWDSVAEDWADRFAEDLRCSTGVETTVARGSFKGAPLKALLPRRFSLPRAMEATTAAC